MEYKVIRSARKTISMEIGKGGQVLVRAPKKMPEKAIDDFVNKHSKWAEKHILAVLEREKNHPPLDPKAKKLQYQLALEVLTNRVNYYAPLMGITPTSIRITGAEKRFGSCSSKNAICFSYRLMEYSPRAIDYVVVHELAHIRHKNHGPLFYKEIERVIPDYKAWAKELKR